MQKPQVRAGTHIAFYSCAKHAVMCAQNHRWGLEPIETSDSDANHAVLHAKTTEEGWDP